MSNIVTTEEFLQNKRGRGNDLFQDWEIADMLIEFANLHVKEALHAVWEEFRHGVDEDMEEVMMNAYPLENIK